MANAKLVDKANDTYNAVDCVVNGNWVHFKKNGVSYTIPIHEVRLIRWLDPK